MSGEMDLENVRALLRRSGVDVWALIDAAISLACAEFGPELRSRRDAIVERLYSSKSCRNCEAGGGEGGAGLEVANGLFDKGGDSPATPKWVEQDEEEDEEQEEDEARELRKILAIKAQIDDPDQSDETLIDLLQRLGSMDITFTALKESDIARHLNGLRKHQSSEVRRLVKLVIRKWKELVDEWVKSSSPGDGAAEAFIAEGDSPQQIQAKQHQNGRRVEDSSHSPYYPRGSSSSEGSKPKLETRQVMGSRQEAELKQRQPTSVSSTSHKLNESKEDAIDMERLASARKRLHENYREAENAKKQRTIQVMDLHEIPKPKNSFFARNKGGFHGRH